jgi:hypothetical protein
MQVSNGIQFSDEELKKLREYYALCVSHISLTYFRDYECPCEYKGKNATIFGKIYIVREKYKDMDELRNSFRRPLGESGFEHENIVSLNDGSIVGKSLIFIPNEKNVEDSKSPENGLEEIAAFCMYPKLKDYFESPLVNYLNNDIKEYNVIEEQLFSRFVLTYRGMNIILRKIEEEYYEELKNQVNSEEEPVEGQLGEQKCPDSQK